MGFKCIRTASSIIRPYHIVRERSDQYPHHSILHPYSAISTILTSKKSSSKIGALILTSTFDTVIFCISYDYRKIVSLFASSNLQSLARHHMALKITAPAAHTHVCEYINYEQQKPMALQICVSKATTTVFKTQKLTNTHNSPLACATFLRPGTKASPPLRPHATTCGSRSDASLTILHPQEPIKFIWQSWKFAGLQPAV